jgi:hypothetical protein
VKGAALAAQSGRAQREDVFGTHER